MFRCWWSGHKPWRTYDRSAPSPYFCIRCEKPLDHNRAMLTAFYAAEYGGMKQRLHWRFRRRKVIFEWANGNEIPRNEVDR